MTSAWGKMEIDSHVDVLAFPHSLKTHFTLFVMLLLLFFCEWQLSNSGVK